jgi:NADH-quinone oxidoreductase subunit B
MCDPKWVVAFGVCTCTGGFYDNYATVQGIDTIVPVDIYIPGCPPRPEAVLDGLIKLQEKIEKQKQLSYPNVRELKLAEGAAADASAFGGRSGSRKR